MRVAIDKFRSLSSAFFYFRGSSISALVSTQLEGRCACEGRQTNLYGSSAGNDWSNITWPSCWTPESSPFDTSLARYKCL